METKRFRLASMPGAQAHVEITMDNGRVESIALVSYVTDVIKIVLGSETPYWTCSGTYSRTTAKHIGRFTREFFGGNYYSVCKELEQTGECPILTEDEIFYATNKAFQYWHDNISRRYWGNY